MNLLAAAELELSSVVANARMNRQRNLLAYRQELGFDPSSLVRGRAERGLGAAWFDLCCGAGRALIEADQRIDPGLDVSLDGLDLIDMFDSHPASPRLRLIAAGIDTWSTARRYDLITCVHGIHYLGDKLATIARLATWLSPDGVLVATLDLGGFRFEDGGAAGRAVARWLRAQGVEYNRRRRLIRCVGTRRMVPPFAYLGADDRAGPNYTGQPAVTGVYARSASR